MVSDRFLIWFQMDLNDVLDSSSVVVFVEVQLGNRSSLERKGYLNAGRGEGARREDCTGQGLLRDTGEKGGYWNPEVWKGAPRRTGN